MFKVLAIDDEAPIRQWLEFCINKIDKFQVVGVASNGKEALELFKSKRPDIVVTDIEMPGMTGLEVLKQMQLIDSEFYAIVLTSHEDFSYARQALHLGTAEYILKTEISDISLTEVLQEASRHISESSKNSPTIYEHGKRNHFLQSIALGKHSMPVDELELKNYNIPLVEGNVIALDILNLDSALNSQEILKNLKGLKNVTSFSFGFDHTIVLANPTFETKEEMKRTFIRTCEETVDHQACYMGISEIGNSLCVVHKVIQTARQRCSLSFYAAQKHVFYEEVGLKEEIKHGEAYKASFSKELLGQEYTKAIETKNKMIHDVIKEQPTDIEQMKKMMGFFSTSLLHFTKDDIPEIENQVATVNRQIQDASCMDELLTTMNSVFLSFEKKTKMRQDYSSGIMDAISYMEKHYSEKITLAMVANVISFSPEYFSRLFMKETGMNFVVYLNNIRMKNAVKLLETTNLKVYEIAEKSGYSSLSYFSTAFKKKFGQNPYEYQMNARK
ncbi:MAG TPA: response regulator [Candidatus Merdenecus merdavium]|nr:response regulator [Candidatus Merdenecus merdavium]